MLCNRRHFSMEKRTRCSAWEEQEQPVETNCIPRAGWKRGWMALSQGAEGFRPTSHCDGHLSLTITDLKYNHFWLSTFWIVLHVEAEAYHALSQEEAPVTFLKIWTCLYVQFHMCTQPPVVREVSLWSLLWFLTKIKMVFWKEMCTKVISHKHQRIQMRKILKAGTSGIILKLRTIFSKTGRHWDFEHLTDT